MPDLSPNPCICTTGEDFEVQTVFSLGPSEGQVFVPLVILEDVIAEENEGFSLTILQQSEFNIGMYMNVTINIEDNDGK